MSKSEKIGWIIALILGAVIIWLAYQRFVNDFIPLVPGINS